MTLYAESSAIVSWLLAEDRQDAVRGALSSAEIVFASHLVLVECERVLIRASVGGRISETAAADRRAIFRAAAAHWNILHLDTEVIDRAKRPFPCEPIRTLDALHLSFALMARSAVPGLQLLSLDERIRQNAHQLGFELLPSA